MSDHVVNNTLDNMSELRLTAPPSPLTATINAPNAGNNTNVNADRDIFKSVESGTPTVTFKNQSLDPPVSPSPSQQKFLQQRKTEVRKQLHAYQTCHVKFKTSNEYQHYQKELSNFINEYGMLPIMIFKEQIVVTKQQDLYDTAGVIRYVEKAPSDRYSLLLKKKLISWGMDPQLFIGNKVDTELLHITTALVFKIIMSTIPKKTLQHAKFMDVKGEAYHSKVFWKGLGNVPLEPQD